MIIVYVNVRFEVRTAVRIRMTAMVKSKVAFL